MNEKVSIQLSPLEKVSLIEDYIHGIFSYNQALALSGVSTATFIHWVHLYRFQGPTAFLPLDSPTVYPPQLKLNAVSDYLDGKGSLFDICDRYSIRNHSTLRKWIKVYNDHGTFKSHTGGSSMNKGRKTTLQERIRIVDECLAKTATQHEIADKYQVSYQQLHSWVKKYKELGPEGLEDRRGHVSGTLPARTPEEELQAQIAHLKQQNYRLQMENDFLKKLKELERGRF